MGSPFASGTEVSRYRIAERIGAGGMGEVYSAEDPRLGRHVALRSCRRELVENEDRGWKEEMLRAGRRTRTSCFILLRPTS
ncbi:MAG: hypothetical protein KY459_12505 [Acidobacteria bacterium]|nr:hypothetical protein [Acidobacteriota bacterium]